ncbi:hypothetical protein CYLTODRAFT_467352 [Cylindrobasidium torrendii FP15055 ss-10]|uniref:Zn(2)-C6 fungal-type domain-containing protein n=1 Tax=Cylindrobasidium torrendii FP15055 ss-10 TaxID=1314674 RepID=A0A0D7B2U8_9AGAR|nr:hypothetical protein CYLTODRAFT_467352 [Cylindrobasidium torrendii FP15055 ss-10]
MFTKFSVNQDSGAPRATKRRKAARPRACNACRQRKIKCDADQRIGQFCSNCQAGNVVCLFTDETLKATGTKAVHIEPSTRQTTDGYVESLEQRLAVMEALVQQLQTNSSQIDSPSSSNTTLVNPQHGMHTELSLCPPTDIPAPAEFIKQHEADIIPDLVDVFEKLEIESSPVHFYGKISGPSFIHQARTIRARLIEDKEIPVNQFSEPNRRNEREERKLIWTVPPWEAQLQDTVACHYQFPEPELMASLIDLYFVWRNLFIPLLHRPSFESSVAQGLHLHDHGFASVVLLVCAIASRHSDDPRVLLESDTSLGRQSAGWKYFIQVPALETSVFSWPTLHDLQRCALAAIYTQGCSIPRGFWTMSGIGLKIAQDLALHRRQTPKRNMRRTEYELYKRAFWVLVWLDQSSSLAMGRTVTIQDDDIATELPLLCDDEYWFTDTGEDLLEQPPGQPSTIVFFVEYLRLMRIHISAMRFIYSANTDPRQIDNIIVDLDSALNQWHSTIPSHLTWDPHREDIAFFQQSVALNCAYNSTLITVHRSSMLDDTQRPTHPSSAQVFANLAVCTNAAQTVVHSIERQHNRGLLANATTLAMVCSSSNRLIPTHLL